MMGEYEEAIKYHAEQIKEIAGAFEKMEQQPPTSNEQIWTYFFVEEIKKLPHGSSEIYLAAESADKMLGEFQKRFYHKRGGG